jgi:O-antigen ligase
MFFIFFTCIFFFFYNFGALFQPVYLALHIPPGFSSAPTLGIAALCSMVFFFRNENISQVMRAMLYTVLAWAPWLIYLAFRCDFDDPYSSKKLILMIFAQFGSIVMICFAFHRDREKFARYFYVSSMGMITILLIYFFMNHDVITRYSTRVVERFTTENINPIGLARSFAIGAVVLMVWGRFPYWIKAGLCLPFLVGIYLTGSRGPMLSALIIIVCHYFWSQTNFKFVAVRLFLSCILLGIALWAANVYFQDPIDKYLSRGNSQGMYKGSGRYAAFIETRKEFLSAPFLGVGLGKFGKSGSNIISAERKSYRSYGDINRSYPHNILYEVLAELGIVGAILFVMLLKPGTWMFDFSNKFIFLFLLCFLFALTSGDFFTNGGVFIFGYIARFNRKARESLDIAKRGASPELSSAVWSDHQTSMT